MSAEFQKWLHFYGKVSGDYELMKGDFLTETDMLERINSATWVRMLSVEVELCWNVVVDFELVTLTELL